MNGEGKIILEPETILEIRIKKLQNRAITEYLVKWKNLPVEEATWEDDFFMHTHPWLSSVEDNTCLKGRGMLSPRQSPIQSPCYV
jgi:hypothetical protein